MYYEVIKHWSDTRKKMARPKNIHKTTQKTYMIYEEDVEKITQSEISAKDIIRLGLKALESGWSPHAESKSIDEMKDRVKSLSWTLQSYIDKFNKLALIVENGLKVEVDPEVVKTEQLTQRLKEIEEMEKKFTKK